MNDEHFEQASRLSRVLHTYNAIAGRAGQRVYGMILGGFYEPVIKLYAAQYAILIEETIGRKPSAGVESGITAFVANPGQLLFKFVDDVIVVAVTDEEDQGFDKLAQILKSEQIKEDLQSLTYDDVASHLRKVLEPKMAEVAA